MPASTPSPTPTPGQLTGAASSAPSAPQPLKKFTPVNTTRKFLEKASSAHAQPNTTTVATPQAGQANQAGIRTPGACSARQSSRDIMVH